MTIESIYENQYRGETYRAGVAYLRVTSPRNDRAPRAVGRESLEQQRQMIAEAARGQRTIIVAEFIDYGTDRGFRPAFKRLAAFAEETRVQEVFVVHENFLDHRERWFHFLMRYLIENDLNLIPAED
jgi:DNA invertase Pin-like site-specific DNA recombinase